MQRRKLKKPVSPPSSCATVLLLWRLSGAMGTFTAVWLCQLSSSAEGSLSSHVQTGERAIYMMMVHTILPAADPGPMHWSHGHYIMTLSPGCPVSRLSLDML